VPLVVRVLFAVLVGVAVGVVLFDRFLMPAVVRHGQEVRVPAVTGRELAEAQRTLQASGLEPVLTEGRYHPGVPAGMVLEVQPPVGLSVKEGRQVHITPSLGEHQRRVPNLLGHTLRMARLIAGDAGLRIGEIGYAATHLAPPDQILAMSPEPGAPAQPNGQITLLLSRKRSPVPSWLPDLRGMAGWRAAALLRRSGFRVSTREGFGGMPGTVVYQAPGPGTPLWPGSHVELEVAPGSAPGRRGRFEG